MEKKKGPEISFARIWFRKCNELDLSLANELVNWERSSYVPSAGSEVCYWYHFSLLVPFEGSPLDPESRLHLSNNYIRKPYTYAVMITQNSRKFGDQVSSLTLGFHFRIHSLQLLWHCLDVGFASWQLLPKPIDYHFVCCFFNQKASVRKSCDSLWKDQIHNSCECGFFYLILFSSSSTFVACLCLRDSKAFLCSCHSLQICQNRSMPVYVYDSIQIQS